MDVVTWLHGGADVINGARCVSYSHDTSISH